MAQIGWFTLPPLVRFSDRLVQALASAREELDALNVFPVPDGDTGTNLLLTFEAANEALRDALAEQGGVQTADLTRSVAAYYRGLLLGARGSSGVIMSQLVGALVRRLTAAPTDERPAVSLAEALTAATAAAYAAVGEPVEGTVLSVARAASDASRLRAADPDALPGEVLVAAAAAAREALRRTPEQLPVLRRAGIVDAGGSGLCVVLDAAETAATGRPRPRGAAGPRRSRVPVPMPADDLTEEGPAYEVMYLLEADDERVPPLRQRLLGLGDSLVVVGGEGLWNVHVHTDDVGAAIEAGIETGRPYRVRVTHFAEQVAAAQVPPRAGRRVVVVAYGKGLARLFAQAGAEVVTVDPGQRPTAAELVAAVRVAGAVEVLLLPNDPDVAPVAEAAARLAQEDDGIRVAVVATRAQVQGLAALAVHDPGRSLDADLVEMTAAARHARTGSVTVAAEHAVTSAGRCRPGDVLGSVEGDYVVVGDDLFTVAVDVLERMLGGGGELLTLVYGAGAAGLGERCAEHLATTHPLVDVTVYDGGHEQFALLLGVE
jgi:DAK2 domain fusion protein YloV